MFNHKSKKNTNKLPTKLNLCNLDWKLKLNKSKSNKNNHAKFKSKSNNWKIHMVA